MLKELIFIAAIVAVVWVVVFQIGVPLVSNKPMFPAFRRNNRRSQLEAEIASVNEAVDVQMLEGHLNSKRSQLESK